MGIKEPRHKRIGLKSVAVEKNHGDKREPEEQEQEHQEAQFGEEVE